MKYKRKIYGYECDIYGHLNNASYLHLYEEARSEALEEMHFPLQKFIEQNIHIYIIRIEIDFQKSISLGEEVTITTRITDMNRLWGIWFQEIHNSRGECCNQARVKGVFTKNGKPFRLERQVAKQIEGCKNL